MKEALRQLAAAFGLLTRLPVWRLIATAPISFAASAWAWPLVGAVIGALGGAIYAAAHLAFSPALAALWTLAAMALITGALHEDGLADTADGFFGGRDRTRKLAIMRDSQIGSYGTLALIFSVALRAAAIAQLAAPARVATALVVAGALARAGILGLAATTRPARTDGLAASLSHIPKPRLLIGLAIALALTALLLPALTAIRLIIAAATIGIAMRMLALHHIQGHSGDVLGATALLTETALLSLLSL